MSSGGHRQLYLLCRHSILVAIAVVLGARGMQAQDPLHPATVGEGHALAMTDRTVTDPDWEPSRFARLTANGDTIVPGRRDFLEPNAPNPFGVASPVTRIAYSLADESFVEVRIYDFYYNEVVMLVSGTQAAGRHVILFNPPPTMPSGMYFYELKTIRTRELRRLMYIK